jgi:hypothetical protein
VWTECLPRVPCVPCVSRLPPVSFYRYCKYSTLFRALDLRACERSSFGATSSVAPSSMMLGTFLLVVAAESATSTPFVGANVLRASHQLFLGGTWASPPPLSLCMNMGLYTSDNYCDSPGSELPMCAYGADCVDCAPRMPRLPPQPPVSSPPRPPTSTPPAPAAPAALCINSVTRIGMPACASDGCCNDGGPGAEDPDTDCADCGIRQPLPLPTASAPPSKGVCLETRFCADGANCGSRPAVHSSPPPVALPPPSPPRMPPTPGSISAGTPSPPSPKSTAPPPLAPPSAPSPPRPFPPPPPMHPPSSPPTTSLPPPQGATPHTHAYSAATGRKATALQGEKGRFACLLSMAFFAMAGLVARLVGLCRALRSSTMRDGTQGARGSRRGRSQPGCARWRVWLAILLSFDRMASVECQTTSQPPPSCSFQALGCWNNCLSVTTNYSQWDGLNHHRAWSYDDYCTRTHTPSTCFQLALTRHGTKHFSIEDNGCCWIHTNQVAPPGPDRQCDADGAPCLTQAYQIMNCMYPPPPSLPSPPPSPTIPLLFGDGNGAILASSSTYWPDVHPTSPSCSFCYGDVQCIRNVSDCTWTVATSNAFVEVRLNQVAAVGEIMWSGFGYTSVSFSYKAHASHSTWSALGTTVNVGTLSMSYSPPSVGAVSDIRFQMTGPHWVKLHYLRIWGLPSPPPSPSPPPPSPSPPPPSPFVYISTVQPWVAHRAACQALGGDLASIHSAAENAAVLAVIPQSAAPWIGATDAVSEGTWRWSDGTPWDYSNWAPGEPNDEGGNEDCALLYASGAWNDGQCPVSDRGAVCRRPSPSPPRLLPSPSPPPPSAPLYGQGYVGCFHWVWTGSDASMASTYGLYKSSAGTQGNVPLSTVSSFSQFKGFCSSYAYVALACPGGSAVQVWCTNDLSPASIISPSQCTGDVTGSYSNELCNGPYLWQPEGVPLGGNFRFAVYLTTAQPPSPSPSPPPPSPSPPPPPPLPFSHTMVYTTPTLLWCSSTPDSLTTLPFPILQGTAWLSCRMERD